MTTTPNEFLQFAREMGLEQIKSTSLSNNNGYTTTGLSVLNNLCHLIEQIHTLKIENDRLRAHLELVNHVEKYFLKINEKKPIHGYDEEKSSTLSPSNSLKIKKHGSPTLSISSRERQGIKQKKIFFFLPKIIIHIKKRKNMIDSNTSLVFNQIVNYKNIFYLCFVLKV
jgi:regulator of replication initiation timing